MPYTANKKIAGLDPATTPLAAANEVPLNQAGTTVRASLTAIEAKVFDAKTALTPGAGETAVAIVRQTDGSLRQVALNDIVPPLNITNAKIAAGANIGNDKLATITEAGKVQDSATSAAPALSGGAYSSAAGNDKIVKRDSSGNFAAGTITASLSGNATTASSLTPGATIGMTGGDIAYTSPTFTGATNVSAAATINNNAVTFAKMQDSAAAGLSVVGRSTNTAGDFAEIPALTDGHVLRRLGTAVGFGQIVTAGIADATSTTTGITNPKLRQSAALSVIGRSEVSAGAPADITGTANQVLRVDASGSALDFGQVATAGIADATSTATGITNSKLRQSLANSVIGRSSNATGAPADIQALSEGAVLRLVSGVLGFGAVTNDGIAAGAVDDSNIATNAAITLSKLGSGALPTNITARYSEITGTPYKGAARLATTANLTATYANGTAGVGATLTNNGTLGALSIDGSAVAASDRILVKDQTSAAHNGIYTVTNTGSAVAAWVLTRVTDADTNAELGSAVVTVTSGTANGGRVYMTFFKATNTVGTTAMPWYLVLTGGPDIITNSMLIDGVVTEDKIDPNAKIRGATGGGTDRVFYENDQEVTTNYTISTNKNAMSAGPITVNSGIVVTVPNGSTWTIV